MIIRSFVVWGGRSADNNYNLSMNKTLGDRVLLARRDLNINQDELGRRVGISRPFISDIERGKTTNVGVETVFALAEALGVQPAYLLGISDVMVDESDDDTLAGGRAVYVVGDMEEYSMVQELLKLFQGLRPADQVFALGMMRRMGGGPRVIGDE